jgi:hypothetical protein
MGPGALDEEIARRLARRLQLRADAGITGLKGAFGQVRPIAADRSLEQGGAAGIDRVVDALHPFDVGTEARPPRQIEREMHSERGGVGHGIDQPAERRGSSQGEINAPRQMDARNQGRRDPGDRARHRLGAEPCRIDQHAGSHAGGLCTADLQLEPVRRDRAALDRAAQGQHRSALLRVALQGQHQRMAVDDPGFGREEPGNGA